MKKENSSQTTIIDRLKTFHSYSGYLVLLVLFTGIVAAITLIPHKSHSTGVDPAIPVDNNIENNIRKAAADGSDSYKALITGNTTPEQISRMLQVADEVGISITTRPIGISTEDYTNKLNAGINGSGVSVDKSSLYISCCANEPEVDEPKDPTTEANDMKYFLQHFAYTNQASIGSYVINANGTFWMDYYVDYMEALGPDALKKIDYTPINDYGHVGGQLDAVVDFLSLFYSNPQVYIYETGPMYPDRAPQTYEEFVNQLLACQASPNCIGTMLFNPYWQNGDFVTENWHSFSQADIISILSNPDLRKQYGTYIKQIINQLAIDWLKYKNGEPCDAACLKNAGTFEALLEAALARVSQSYSELGNENLYGVSSYVDTISCGNGSLTYSYNVSRSDPLTTVADVSIGMSYRLLAPDGTAVGGGSLGGSAMYGGNFNRPGGDKASTGNIISLQPGYEDQINHTITFPPGFNGTLEVNADLGFKSQYGQNHIVNSCKMVITNGACGTFVCTGGSVQDIYCRANNDQVRPAPRKPDVVAPDWESVHSCNEGGKNKLSISYTARGVPKDEIRQYRLGFQITGIQLLRELADQGKDILSEPIGQKDFDPNQVPDNPPVSIQKRLSINTINSSSNQGYIKAKLKDFKLKLNDEDYDKRATKLHPNKEIDSGVDLLEFVFERMCYLSSIKSTNPNSDTFCDKIFSDLNKLDLGSYDDLSSYEYFPGLKSEILSCNGGGVSQYNKQAYQKVGGAEYPVNPDGSGSYILSRWEMTPYKILPPFPVPGVTQKGDIKIHANMNVDLVPTRVSWMISSLLSNEAGFLAHSFESKEQFDKYYDMCLRDPISQTGGAAKITFMLVLEEGKPLQCPPGKIPLDAFEWKRVKTSNGEAFIPGLGTLYRFLSNVQNSAENDGNLPNQAPGISLRFNPDSENPCNNLIFLPNVENQTQ